MKIAQKKKPQYGMWGLLLLAALYTGYCIGTLEKGSISLENLPELIRYVIFHPFPIRITEQTKNALLIGFVAWLFAFVTYIGNQRNYMFGREYGQAEFIEPDVVTKRMADKNQYNKILSEHVRVSLDTRFTGLNNNAIFIGGSGAGKSLRVVKPNGLACTSAYVFTDPKGELLKDMGVYLQAHGYTVRVLNLVDMQNSHGYNPFRYIRTEEDIIRMITNLITNTTPKNAYKGDPFWEKAEAMYLQALFLYVWKEYPESEQNFRSVMELLNMAKIPENEEEWSQLDDLMFALDEKHPAFLAYNKVRSGASDTVRSIIISANSRLAYLQNEAVLKLLDRDEMDIPTIGTGIYENPDNKVALFCVIPDYDKSYNFIIGMLYTQMFQELYYIADHIYGGKLPVHVTFWMDEFANIALPEGFCELLATMRSREISCNIIIQNMAQIKALFEKTWETITGNCDTFVYLGGNEQSTHKYVSEMLGKWTIDKRSSGETLGRNGSSSRNYDIIGRDLMTPDEVRLLDNSKCIILIRGFNPIIDDKYDTLHKQAFHEACAYGEFGQKKGKSIMQGEDKIMSMELLNEQELNYFEKQKNDSNVNILKMTPAELLALDIQQMLKEEAAEEPEDEGITIENVQDWIKENNRDMRRDYENSVQMEEDCLKIEEELKVVRYAKENRQFLEDYIVSRTKDEEKQVIRQAIEAGLSEMELKAVLAGSNAEQMQIILDAMLVGK